MAKYVLLFSGGEMAEGEEAQKAMMEAWMGWFGELGAAVVDPGAPFGEGATVTADGSAGTANAATGYTILEAAGMAAAKAMAKGCPVLADGGAVDIKEAMAMG